MSDIAEVKAALIQGPIAAADATGKTGVYRIAISGSAQSFAIPNGLVAKRGFVALFCTVDVQWAFGIGSAPAIALNEASAPGTGDANAGATLPAGQWWHFPIAEGATHVGWIGTSGFLEFYSSQAVAG